MKKLNRFILIFFAVSLVAGSLFAQSGRLPYSKKEYLYIQHDSCYLEQFDDSPNLDKFFDKLDKLYFQGEGQISILHFGGSHIQAGIWSYSLRKQFESIIPDTEGAPGLVFPFSIAKTNHPYYYRSDYEGEWEISKVTDREPVDTIGLIGITAKTTDSLAQIRVLFNPVANINSRRFDKITVFHNIDDTIYQISLAQEELIDTFLVNRELRATEFYLTETIDTFDLRITRVDTVEGEFLFYGALLENSNPGIKYSGVGINGAATFSYLKADYFDTHLKAIKPDLVIFSIGVNDAAGKNFSKLAYINNYKKLADKMLMVNPDCAIIFTTNNDFYYYRGGVNPHYNDVYNSMVDLAKDYNACVWNMFRVMGGCKSINYWRNDNIANKDRIHFTRAGYKILAGLLFDAIMKDYEDHLREKSK